jgi:UPF0755 protein
VKRRKKGFWKRAGVLAAVILLLAGVLAGWKLYERVFGPGVRMSAGESPDVYIPTGSTFEQVVRSLSERHWLKDEAAFRWLAHTMKYDRSVLPGRYRLKQGMSNRELVALLRSGKQLPVRCTFNNIRLKEELAERISAQIEAKETALLHLLEDPDYVSRLGFDTSNILSMFIPDTYEFYWNTSADKFLQRMKAGYDRFWNDQRTAKAREIGLTRFEVSVLASIVQKETNVTDEKSVIAGVYMNRLHKGWKLEADPTLVYASGNFGAKRVLDAMKEIDSPYNTYKYTGLPPGPICLPEISSIDAVLNYSAHHYMYFCAKDDFSGRHSFAVTYAQHLLNAQRFRKALDRRGIRS